VPRRFERRNGDSFQEGFGVAKWVATSEYLLLAIFTTSVSRFKGISLSPALASLPKPSLLEFR
jgi:hypothetical protein